LIERANSTSQANPQLVSLLSGEQCLGPRWKKS
jgi:hypothetical protein